MKSENPTLEDKIESLEFALFQTQNMNERQSIWNELNNLRQQKWNQDINKYH